MGNLVQQIRQAYTDGDLLVANVNGCKSLVDVQTNGRMAYHVNAWDMRMRGIDGTA